MIHQRRITDPFLIKGMISVTSHLRKEVIQPHLPVRLPCYDFAPITDFTLDAYEAALGALGFHGVTGGVYKARERIHRGVLTPDY